MALEVTVVSAEEVVLPTGRALGGGAYAVVRTASAAACTHVDEDSYGDCNGYIRLLGKDQDISSTADSKQTLHLQHSRVQTNAFTSHNAVPGVQYSDSNAFRMKVMKPVGFALCAGTDAEIDLSADAHDIFVLWEQENAFVRCYVPEINSTS
uniref:Uncharacterized protein n=1 Tax=Oryza brachyantha TaxID=4533 RepID=J3MZD8_ORYBR